ncbi:MAG: 6-bladed beta-propeller [Longimicrobiales bacterium]|nr:6-bladed beta-propeller [Longimicrobiales bacterium]
MHRTYRSVVGLVLTTLLALVGCAGSDGAGWEGTVTDSAGIEIVTSTGAGQWSAGEAWTVERDLVIGTAEGEPEYQFGQIVGIDVGPEGRVYVYDQQAREARVFSPEGAFLLALGQAGSGPGEFSQAAGPLFVTPGDTVVIPDIMLQRMTFYTTSGEPAGSHALPMTGGIPVKWMELPGEDLVQQAMVMAFPGQQEVEPKNLLLRRRPTGAVIDTILQMPIGETVSFSGGSPSVTLFEAEPMWTVGPEGNLYTGINAEYSIHVYSPEGALLRIVRMPFDRRPITDSDQAELRRIIRGLWQDQGMAPEALEPMSQALGFADAYPAYANLLGGPDGSLWVQRIQTPDEIREAGGTFDIQDMGSATWEVFDDGGRLLGTLEMPPRFTPLAFIDGAFYGVLRDELDVQYAARMVVSRPSAPRGE